METRTVLDLVAEGEKRAAVVSVQDSTNTSTEQHRAAPPEAITEPIEIEPRQKAAALKEFGYVRNRSGLQAIKQIKDKSTLVIIGRFHVDVPIKRHVYALPERLTERPRESGVVLVTYLAPLHARDAGQTLEIHRSDMLARQPKFYEQIQAVKPPHPRKQADFIDALESLAALAPVENRYNATGLVRLNDKLVFLHPAGGGLTEQGTDEQYKIQFPFTIASRLTSIQYGWPATSAPDEQIEDYQTLLKILNIAPGSPGYGDVLFGIHGFSPFSQACDTGGVWAIIHGQTGSMKSATSRLPLQGYAHGVYGTQETSTINLREGASTPYAIEQVLYYLSGMFAHLDDALKGKNVPDKEVKKFYKGLSIIGGHAVTRQGGKRGIWGQGEGGFGIEPYPRGSGVYTVEILPDSQDYASDLARYIVVSLDGSERVNMPLLTALQDKEAAARMNRATASYLIWLLPRIEEYLQGVARREDAYREQHVHPRTPTSYAKLETGIAALLQYGVSIGAHTEQEAARLLEESRARLVQVALKQKDMMGVDEQHATANDTAHIFYELLRRALRKQKLYAADSQYRKVEARDRDTGTVTDTFYRPQPPLFLMDEETPCMLTDEKPDEYGWKFNESLCVYEPGGPGALEAGVLKWEGTQLLLSIYVKDFKDKIYPIIREQAISQDTPLPGLNELISKLKEQGKLTSTKPTNLHGRNSRTDRCYVLDMTPEPEGPNEESSTEIEEGYID